MLAGAALGFRDRLTDLIRGKPVPASSSTRMPLVLQQFTPEFFKSLPPRIRVSWRQYTVPLKSWRGVFALRTADGPVGLWVGRSRGGLLCHVYVFIDEDATRPIAGFTESGCDPGPWRIGEVRHRNGKPYVMGAAFAEVHTWASEAAQRPPGPPLGAPLVISGRAANEVAREQLVVSDGQVVRMTVHDGFFAGELPKGTAPQELRSLGATGRLLAKHRCKQTGGNVSNTLRDYFC